MDKYQDRSHAGQVLAQKLKKYAAYPNFLILGLARGGIPVAYEIAKALAQPLDVFIVRKLGVPDQEELAMGAIASGETLILNHKLIQALQISQESVNTVINKEKKELERRELQYRGGKAFPYLKGKTILIVDDGIATGASLQAAISALRKHEPKKIIGAVPVAPEDSYKKIARLVDKLICPLLPDDFQAVGSWYQDFPQTSDEEIRHFLSLMKISS